MQAVKKPYEILVRYDEDGNLKGAHVVWNTIVTLDDGTTRCIQGNPEPVDIGAGKGFPLADIGSAVAADALIATASAQAERDAAVSAKSQAEADKAASDLRIADLEGQIAALQQGIAA